MSKVSKAQTYPRLCVRCANIASIEKVGFILKINQNLRGENTVKNEHAWLCWNKPLINDNY